MQTAVLYAMSLGLEIDFGGPASWVKKIDETGTYGKYGQQYWLDLVQNDYEALWKSELGYDQIKDPEELRNILGFDTNFPSASFVISRSIDLVRDTNMSEKFDYLKSIRSKKK
jgi:hypothetical protein